MICRTESLCWYGVCKQSFMDIIYVVSSEQEVAVERVFYRPV